MTEKMPLTYFIVRSFLFSSDCFGYLFLAFVVWGFYDCRCILYTTVSCSPYCCTSFLAVRGLQEEVVTACGVAWMDP